MPTDPTNPLDYRAPAPASKRVPFGWLFWLLLLALIAYLFLAPFLSFVDK